MNYSDQEFFTKAQAAKKIGISVKGLERLMKRKPKIIYWHKIGGLIKFSQSQIDDFYKATVKNSLFDFAQWKEAGLGDSQAEFQKMLEIAVDLGLFDEKDSN